MASRASSARPMSSAFLARWVRDQRGATAIEYGLIAALISLACVIAFLSLGINLSDLFFGISNTLEGR